MKQARITDEQIVSVLKEHEAGAKTAGLACDHGVSEATFTTRRPKFDGMDVSAAEGLRQLEDENAELKKLLAEQMLDVAGAYVKKMGALAVKREAIALLQPEIGARMPTAISRAWRLRTDKVHMLSPFSLDMSNTSLRDGQWRTASSKALMDACPTNC